MWVEGIDGWAFVGLVAGFVAVMVLWAWQRAAEDRGWYDDDDMLD